MHSMMVSKRYPRLLSLLVLACIAYYGVDLHWWPRIRAPRAQNGLRIRRRFAFEV